MNKFKISTYSLIIVSILKVSMVFFLRELSVTTESMGREYIEMQEKVNYVSTFEDSLIYHPEFRQRVLGTGFTKNELDSVISNNQLEIERTIEELEILINEKMQLERKFNIYKGIDSVLELLFVVTIGLMIYYWIKK